MIPIRTNKQTLIFIGLAYLLLIGLYPLVGFLLDENPFYGFLAGLATIPGFVVIVAIVLPALSILEKVMSTLFGWEQYDNQNHDCNEFDWE